MSEYTFQHIEALSTIDFSKNVLWIFHADKIPPHIGFSIEHTFFSLKVSGKDDKLPVSNPLKLIHKGTIPSVFIQLNSTVDYEEVQREFSQYEKAILGETTCLTPIKKLLHQPQVKQLSELLLAIEPQIEKVAGINLPENYTSLPLYSVKDIQQYIQQYIQQLSN